jgi:plasmid stabilization system protein ParE
MRVRLLPEAEKELLEAARWYSEQSVGLDYEFMRCIDEATAKIGRTPITYPVVHQGKRRILVKRFPYSIIFDVIENEILIYAVFHFSRNPKSWKRRS